MTPNSFQTAQQYIIQHDIEKLIDILDDTFINTSYEANEGFSRLCQEANDKKETLLHYAAQHDTCHVTTLTLIQYKASVNAQDHNGNTPLHIAALRNKLLVVNALLEYNADPSITNAWGRNAYSYTHSGSDLESLLNSYRSPE